MGTHSPPISPRSDDSLEKEFEAIAKIKNQKEKKSYGPIDINKFIQTPSPHGKIDSKNNFFTKNDHEHHQKILASKKQNHQPQMNIFSSGINNHTSLHQDRERL